MQPLFQEYPDCPVCGAAMQKRKAGRGKRAGSLFWGCTRYPGCQGVLSLAVGNQAARTRRDREMNRQVLAGESRVAEVLADFASRAEPVRQLDDGTIEGGVARAYDGLQAAAFMDLD